MAELQAQPRIAQRIARGDPDYPVILSARLGERTPSALAAIGRVILLAHRKTALFCSAGAPGDMLPRALDAVRTMRDNGATVISGFHSPFEKECLRILLNGRQPIIICPARAIQTMRIPPDCCPAFEAGRLLFLSPFGGPLRRVDKDSATKRNKLVAALADEAFLPHVSPGGLTARIAQMLADWGVPLAGVA